MTEQEIQKRVFALAELAPRDPQLHKLPDGATEAQIDAFERRFEITFPDPLRTWLKFSNGAPIGRGGLCKLDESDSVGSVGWHYTYPATANWKERGWIPVGGDGCGNEYVLATMVVDGPGMPVLFIDCSLDHETPAYVVSSDLWHFLLANLDNEIERNGWPCKKEPVLTSDPGLVNYHTWPKCWEVDSN